MITIKALTGFSLDELFHAFEQAFIDYQVKINRITFGNMMTRRGFTPDLSYGAFDDKELVAFTLNGTGTFMGIKTAYDTGTGTIPGYRGRGLAKRIFEYSVPLLRMAGMKLYLLEVIRHNEKAAALYKKMGFRITRELHYYVHSKKDLQLKTKILKDGYKLTASKLPLPPQAGKFEDSVSSWQNSLESIYRCHDHFQLVAVTYRDRMEGFCIYEPSSGDISKLAVSGGHRRLGLGTLLLHWAVDHITQDTVKILNVPWESADMIAFLKFHGIEPVGSQYEMIREL
jgi:ribosomal protein S18 acetylase RimI-like enzyme